MQSFYQLRKANIKDVQKIEEIAKKAIYQKEDKKRNTNGFLIPYSIEEYKNFIEKADHFLLVLVKNNVVGFLLAHSSQYNFGGEIYDEILQNEKNNFMVVRQICIEDQYHKLGLGKELYRYLEKKAKEQKIEKMFCFIWEDPICNKPSQTFHKKMGWKKQKSYQLKNKTKIAGIWMKKII
jgi:N-acetylglutamate synthase-like GNAT family acetyltransferase